MNNYRIDNMKKNLTAEMNRYEALGRAWGAVVRQYKKDGGDFASIGKCFSGATVHKCAYGAGSEISVYTSAEGCGYVSDDIPIRVSLNCYDKNQFRPDESRIIKCGKLYDEYDMNATELSEAIGRRAAYYTKAAEETRQQLAALDNAVATYAEAFRAALDALQQAAGGKNLLYDAIIKAVDAYSVTH